MAVVMMCATDVNGWEDDSTAAVVEHRTGAASGPLPHEADLYAVSAWTALQQMNREADGVAASIRVAPPDTARNTTPGLESTEPSVFP